MLFNELDLLEIRLNELDGIVDRFVISESRHTHSGNKKPLVFEANKSRFEKFLHKITHIVYDADLSLIPHDREKDQRNSMFGGLDRCSGEDVIVITDCDEIPRSSAIPSSLADGEVVGFRMRPFEGYMNRAADGTWSPVGAIKYSDLARTTLSDVRWRTYNTEGIRFVEDAGWHFSWMGGLENMVYKLNSFMHQEWNNNHSEAYMSETLDSGFPILHEESGANEKCYHIISPNSPSLPKYVLDNPEKFIHMMKI